MTIGADSDGRTGASNHRSADADGRDVRTSVDRPRLPVALTAGEAGQNQAAAR